MKDIAGWRQQIDDLDSRLVQLLNERANAAQEIGKLKLATQAPIYEPEREKTIFENVYRANQGPLPDSELRYVYERIIEVMRNLQTKNQQTNNRQTTNQQTTNTPTTKTESGD